MSMKHLGDFWGHHLQWPTRSTGKDPPPPHTLCQSQFAFTFTNSADSSTVLDGFPSLPVIRERV